jgi:undecaprenyl-diphosphatase
MIHDDGSSMPGATEASWLGTPVTAPAGLVSAPTAPAPASALVGRFARVAVSVALVVVAALKFGSVRRAVSALPHAGPWWVGGAATTFLVTYVLSTVSLRAAVSTALPIRRTILGQLAAAFANRVTVAGAGGVAVNIRYLERHECSRTASVTALASQWVARLAVHTAALLAAASLAGGSARIWPSPPDVDDQRVVIGLAVAFVAVALLARWKVPWCTRAWASVCEVAVLAGQTIRDTRRFITLLACAGGSALASVVGLWMCLHAVGVHPSVMTVAVVYFSASAVAAVIPAPGGMGAMEAALAASLTTFGLPPAPALTGVLIFRFIGYSISLIGGGLAYRSLRASGYV